METNLDEPTSKSSFPKIIGDFNLFELPKTGKTDYMEWSLR